MTVSKITTAPKNEEVVSKINEIIDNLGGGGSLTSILEAIYPVGSLYMSKNATNPLASLIGTWQLVASNKALWTGDGTNGGTTIAAGLPNVTGLYHSKDGSNNDYSPFTNSSTYTNTSALYSSSVSNKIKAAQTAPSTYTGMAFLALDASRTSSIYSDSVTTVQPPAYVVNVWERIA